MIEIRPIDQRDITAIAQGIRSDNYFDLDDMAKNSDPATFALYGHYDRGEAFGFTRIMRPGNGAEASIGIDTVWNRPSFRGMGTTGKIVGKLCDIISEDFVRDNGVSISAEAISAGGMRFCKDVIYEMCLRGVSVIGSVKDSAEYDDGAAEHGDFEMGFPGDPPNGQSSRNEMAVFLLEQTRRNVWVRDYEARFVRASLRSVCSAHLLGIEPEEYDLDAISGDAMERYLRSSREGEFCKMAVEMILANEMAPELFQVR